MAKTILIVDDEKQLVKLVSSYLEQEGFRTVQANDGREALFVARQEKPDLIVLDQMMPEMDGIEFMKHHRREKDTPIIMLTARVDETDRVLGLELGADDYVGKPFSPRELVARIKAILRRVEAKEVGAEVLRSGTIRLDLASHQLEVAGEVVDLTPSEFDLLAVMLASPGRAFTRLELLERLQGSAYEGYERTIDVHIKNLRAKIEADPKNPAIIETVYGIGYRFAAEG
jgi:DNA-binding response OmpR family regulator